VLEGLSFEDGEPTLVGPSSIGPEFVDHVAQLVKRQTGFALSSYKPSPVGRRLARRRGLLRMTAPQAYAARLASEPHESEQIGRDVMISVTSFMRDPTLFESLRETLVREVAAKGPTDVYRVWVTGCATGEE